MPVKIYYLDKIKPDVNIVDAIVVNIIEVKVVLPLYVGVI